MFAFHGWSGTTEGECVYSFMYTIDGKVYGNTNHWRSPTTIELKGYWYFKFYGTCRFVIYKDCTMYSYGSDKGTRIKAGTVIDGNELSNGVVTNGSQIGSLPYGRIYVFDD